MLRHGRRLLSDGLSRASIENVGNAQLTERLVSGALATSSGTSAFLQAYNGSQPRALHSLAKAFSSFAKRSGSAPAQLYTQLQKVGSLAEVYSETAEYDNTSHSGHQADMDDVLQAEGVSYMVGRRFFSTELPPRKGGYNAIPLYRHGCLDSACTLAHTIVLNLTEIHMPCCRLGEVLSKGKRS